MRSYWHEHTVCPVIGSVNNGLPVSQQRGPFEVAEDGDELRIPTTLEVTAIGANVGEDGADEALFYKIKVIISIFNQNN